MAGDDMEFGLVLNWAFVKSDHVHVDHEFVDLFERAWNACEAPFDFLAFDLCH